MSAPRLRKRRDVRGAVRSEEPPGSYHSLGKKEHGAGGAQRGTTRGGSALLTVAAGEAAAGVDAREVGVGVVAGIFRVVDAAREQDGAVFQLSPPPLPRALIASCTATTMGCGDDGELLRVPTAAAAIATVIASASASAGRAGGGGISGTRGARLRSNEAQMR